MTLQDELKHVSISKILLNPYQPRREFKLDDLEELAASIRTVGLLHPPLVRPLPSSDSYELISGERRLRAAQLASLTIIPVYIRKTSCTLSAKAALIENIQRVDLNPLEIAKALKQLMIDFEYTQDELAKQIGKKRSTIANYLRLLTLPTVIQESVIHNKLSMGHAKVILSLDHQDQQMHLHDLILRDSLSVRAAELLALRVGEKQKKKIAQSIPRDIYLEQVTNKIRERLGTQVKIETKGLCGCICIDYYNLDDLDRLLTFFGIKNDD